MRGKTAKLLTLFGFVLTIGIFVVWDGVLQAEDNAPEATPPAQVFRGTIGVICGPSEALEQVLEQKRMKLAFRGQTYRGESPIEVRVYRSKAGEFVISEVGIQGLACMSHQGGQSELLILHETI